MLGRAAGVTGAAILSDAFCGLICDGHHVSDDMIRLALRACPDRIFLVSDAMATVGGADHFQLYGREIALKDGRLINSDGALAGAHLTMGQALRRLICDLTLDPARALAMAVSIPAEVIGKPELASITARRGDDILLMDSDWRLTRTCADILSDLPSAHQPV
jgi:N-acetylglucosamine-6-phosphate deacetylase